MVCADLNERQPADRLQFDQLYGRYRRAIYRRALAMLGDPADAEDVAQETLLRAWVRFDRLAPAEKCGPWLMRVASNLSIDTCRRRRRIVSRMAPVDGGAETADATLDFVDAAPGPEQVAVVRDELASIERAMATLPATFQATLRMHALNGLTYDEIARRTGVNCGTVRSRIHRARAALQNRMEAAEPMRRV